MDLPKRKPNRLLEYDYSTPNAYFITICTKSRKNFFWTDASANVASADEIPLTAYGRIVRQAIMDIPRHYPGVLVDQFVVMPNHVHLLMQIHSGHDGYPISVPTTSSMINQLKGAVTKKIGVSIWQKGFYDHVVRGDNDYQEIWRYIQGNPGRQTEDKL